MFPVPNCDAASYGPTHHDYPATDIFVSRGTRFRAVTSGNRGVSRIDRWKPNLDKPWTRGGRFVSLVGDDGVRYYGSHLRSVAAGLGPGDRVRVGQLLGFTGDPETPGSASRISTSASLTRRPRPIGERAAERYGRTGISERGARGGTPRPISRLGSVLASSLGARPKVSCAGTIVIPTLLVPESLPNPRRLRHGDRSFGRGGRCVYRLSSTC